MVDAGRASRRARDVLARRPATLGLAGFLVAWWYLVEWPVLQASGPATFAYLFTVSAPPTPTPGWVLAPVSHFFPGHLLDNVVVLLLFGGAAEPHLGSRRYLVVFLLAGWLSAGAAVAADVLTGDGGAVLGASGAIYALATFHGYHYFRAHVDAADRQVAGNAGEFLVAVLGVIYPPLVVAVEFSGATLVTDGATYGHVAGVGVGLALAYLAPAAGWTRQ